MELFHPTTKHYPSPWLPVRIDKPNMHFKVNRTAGYTLSEQTWFGTLALATWRLWYPIYRIYNGCSWIRNLSMIKTMYNVRRLRRHVNFSRLKCGKQQASLIHDKRSPMLYKIFKIAVHCEITIIYWTAKRWRWSMKTWKLTSSVNMTSPPGGGGLSELYETDGLSFASKNRACSFQKKVNSKQKWHSLSSRLFDVNAFVQMLRPEMQL